MVEAVVTFFLEKVSGLLAQEANLICGVDEQVRLLQDKLKWMLLDIKIFDVKRRQDDKVKLWVSQIRDVTYDAEDVIDNFMVKIGQHRRRTSSRGFAGTLSTCITCTYKLPDLHELATQIKEITSRVEEILANKSKHGIQSTEVAGETSTTTMINSYSNEASLAMVRKETRPANVDEVEESNMVGNEESVREVTSLLVRGEPLRTTVVSIVGMGGLGKTTMANKIYKSNHVRRSFDCFAWAYVSQPYVTKALLQAMLKCFKITSTNDQEETEYDLRKKLHECLQGSKYLIVLDDVWNVEAWDAIKTTFPDEENGSRVLITTRNKDVALYVDPSRNLHHELRFLNEEESWELFQEKIFTSRDGSHEVISCPPELEDLGKEMAVKCGGLPLALVVLGGLLSRKHKTHIAWSKVNDNVSCHLSTLGASGSSSCLEILALSYYNLPDYLKPCFLSMGLFPEDYEMKASIMIKYWIAEGFIQRRREEIVEDVAEDYLEELIHRSMIQVAKRKFDGRVKTFRIHDLLRDISIMEAKEDQYFHVYGSINQFSKPNKIRRLAIHGAGLGEKEQCFAQIPNTQHIRLLIFRGREIIGKHFPSFFQGLKLLRVLELNLINESFISLEEIGDLIHLKYLVLRGIAVKKIPNSICRLVNLQFLHLRPHSHKIPSVVFSLIQLRHICVYGLPDLTIKDKYLNRNPLGVDNLTNLQTLMLTSGSWIKDGGFGKLRKLRKLVIRGSLVSYKKKMLESIDKLDGLRSLELKESEEIPDLLPFFNHKFLYKLHLNGRLVKLLATDCFPPNLMKLTLSSSQLEIDPMETLEKLPNLSNLYLFGGSYVGKAMVCSEGGFVKLQVLQLSDLEGLDDWIVKEGALISLRRLVIGGCEHLKMLPDGLRHLSTVQELTLYVMPDEFMDRVKENVGSDWEKIKHIPSVNTKFGKFKHVDLHRELDEVFSNAEYRLDLAYELCSNT